MFLNDPPPSAGAERLLQGDTADGAAEALS